VISQDDERHDAKVRALTIDRAVVLTHSTIPPLPFVHALGVDAFDGVALLEAPAYTDSPAGSNADICRRRWWRWGRKVLRQRRIVGRRRDIGVDRIGNVGAPAN